MKEAGHARSSFFTISDEEEDLFEAIRPGASGSCSRTSPWMRSPRRSGRVTAPRSLINPVPWRAGSWPGSATLAQQDGGGTRPRRSPTPKPRRPREIQVLELVARGMNDRDIARSCSSRDTVEDHVRNILETQIHSRMEAVMVTVREKLIEFS